MVAIKCSGISVYFPTTEDAAEGRRFGRFMVTRVCKIKIHIRRELSRIVLAAKKIVQINGTLYCLETKRI